MFFTYEKETGAKVAIYRFPNLMGHSRPKYNSAVSTFCWAVANDEEFTVNDRNTELELLYIDDALGHTQFLMTQCREAANRLTDPALRRQAMELVNANQKLFTQFYNLV